MSWTALRYRSHERLDEGVERAEDRLAARTVVIKRADPERRAALEREHALSSQLRHPAFRALVGAARDPELALVLEHVEGDSPEAFVARNDEDAARAIAIDLLRALLHLHEHARVHGDLKPANLLVERDRRLRVIDLGLAVPIGARVAGGTPGFVAPEYARGAPASVAGDLYAFGRTIEALGSRTEPLASLVRAACADDPLARPASAAAALAQLGELALPEDRIGALPLVAARLDDLDALAVRADGATCVVSGPSGAGHTRVLQELARRWIERARPFADASLARGAIARAIAMLDPDGAGSIAERAMRAAVRAAQLGVPMFLDDARACDPEEREAIAAMARGLSALGRGALIVAGADDGLAARLEAEGAERCELARLDEAGVRGLLAAASARTPAALVAGLLAATEGRAGRAAQAAALLARHPELSDDAIVHEARETIRAQPPIEYPSLDPHDMLAHAREALASGAMRRAEAIVTAAYPELARRPERHPEAGSILARAWAASGRLHEAEAVFAAIDRDRPTHARVLERLGRYEEALAFARSDESSAELALVGASAALALGRNRDADDLLARGLAASEDDAMRARLLLLSSDVALREGRFEQAIDAARAALRSASGAPLSSAEAHSRLGSAYSLRGDPRTARMHHAHALDAAQSAGDVAALPPYVVNLATAEHALGQLGAAIARYEEAARLATRLGRAAMRAAALTNLAGLLVAVGARDEAARVLHDAREAAERSGSAMYAAQAVLIDAERLGTIDRAAAVDRARAARQRFEAAGATRQALEARLLEAELRHEEESARFCERHEDELARAGLAGRAWLLRARIGADPGAVERAIDAARESGDDELLSRALAAAARIDPSGDRGKRIAEAVEAIERVASTLPAGLRDRFRSDPERREILDAGERRASVAIREARLGDGGRRLLALLRRVLLEGEERRVLEAAVDEAIALTRAERAFLLLAHKTDKRRRRDEDVLVARNLDRDTIRRGRFSRSVAERVMGSGEPVLTAMASDDPAIATRSVVDLGLRSILCVPVRAPSGIVGALYLDHRFETARFDAEDLELVFALGDIIGLTLENARLHREARERARELERANEQVRHENLLAAARVERLEQRLASVPDDEAQEGGIVGRSEILRRALGVARRVAPSDLPVLIEGESGTGKELFARYMHRRSLRAEGPMLAINCGALPETLLESELFGHVRGAFTGASRDHPGLFRSAHAGTVFLDEIGEMPARMQTRLLRVLQEKEVRPVGGERPIHVDVRVIAATNRDLDHEVEAGRFRRDLFFRLVGFRLVLPPLRERADDLPVLAEHALARIAREPGMAEKKLAPRALALLARHAWPGNVRELEQALRRAVLVAEGNTIEPEDLALEIALADRRTALQRFDRGLVEQALLAARGNRTEAARALGVSRMTLHRWMKRYELE